MTGYSFVISDGPDLNKVYPLKSGITLIGRLDTPSNSDPEGSQRWVLTDPAISRTHAEIHWDEVSPPILVHLSKTNATLLDGRIVTGQSLETGPVLQPGQNLRIGQTCFDIQKSEASAEFWSLTEDGTSHQFSKASPLSLESLQFLVNQSGPSLQATSGEDEVYILRRIQGKLWTTPVTDTTEVALASGDIVRLNERRLVLS